MDCSHRFLLILDEKEDSIKTAHDNFRCRPKTPTCILIGQTNFIMETLLVVSNRLLVSMKRNTDGEWEYSMSSGGLVSALSGLKKKMSFTWIGWPGLFS